MPLRALFCVLVLQKIVFLKLPTFKINNKNSWTKPVKLETENIFVISPKKKAN